MDCAVRQVFLCSLFLLASMTAFSDFCSGIFILYAVRDLHDTRRVRKKPRETLKEDQGLKYKLLYDLLHYRMTLFTMHWYMCHETNIYFKNNLYS